MSFSKAALLSSLTCFTLGMGSLGATLYVSHTGDNGGSCCTTSDGCDGDASLSPAIGCWNDGYAGPIEFIIPNTNGISNHVNEATRAGTLQVTSSYSGGTVLSSDNGAAVLISEGSGNIIEVGPSGSELISMGRGDANDPPSLWAIDAGHITLGPQFAYPTSREDCERFWMISNGTFEFTHTGTLGTLIEIYREDRGNIILGKDAVVTVSSNGALDGDDDAILTVTGEGLSSQILWQTTDGGAFQVDDIEITNATFGMAINPGRSGRIVLTNGAIQFTNDFELQDNHRLELPGTGTIEVISGKTGTLSTPISGSGLFVKIGSGKLELRASNDLTGGMRLEDGTVSIDRSDRIGTGQIEFITPAVLELTDSLSLTNNLSISGGAISLLNAAQGTFAGDLSGSGSFGLNDGSTDEHAIFSYSGDSSGFSGSITVSNVTFSLGSALSTSADIDIALSNGADLTLNNYNVSVKSISGDDATVTLGSGTLSIYQTSSTATLDAVISGTGGINLYSADSNEISLVLEGVNTYEGTTRIGSNATIEIKDAENLGAGTAVHIEDEGRLTITDSSNDVVLAQGFEFISGTGKITLDTNSTTLKIEGEIAGSGNLYLSGEGSDSILTLADVSSLYSGAVTIDDATLLIQSGVTPSLTFKDGTLQVEVDTTLSSNSSIFMDSGGGEFSVDSGKTLSILGVISGTSGVTFSGEGTTLLSGINTYEGDTELEKGIVQVSSDANLGASDEDLVFAGDGATPILQVLASMDSARKIKIQGDGGGISVDTGVTASFTGSVNIRSGPPIFTKSGGGDLSILPSIPSTLPQLTVSISEGNFTSNMNLLENSSIAISSGATFTISESRDGSYFGANDDRTISGEGSVIIDGAGTINMLVPSSTDFSQLFNTYQGGTNLKSGILVISIDRALGEPSGTLTMNGGTLKTVVVSGDSSNTINPTRPVVLNVDSTFDISCTTDSPCSSESPCCSLLALSGEVSGPGGIIKTSNGTLSLLNTANTFSGVTRMEGGALRVIDPGSLGNSSSLTFAGGILQVGGSGTYTQNASIESAGGAFSVEPGVSATFSGVISGEGIVTYSGLGTAVPTGVNTYKGGTTFTNGTVQISSDTNLGDSSASILFKGDGATPKLQALADITSTRTIGIQSAAEIIVDSGFTASFTGGVAIGTTSPYTFIKSGDGDLSILPENPSLIPQLNVSIQAGNMTGNMGFLRSSSIQIASGSALTLQTDVDSLYFGTEAGDTISGDGSIVIKGNSELSFLVPLPGATQVYNSYAGGTTLEEGILTISADFSSSLKGVLGSSASILTGSGGTLKTIVLSDQEKNLVVSNRDISLTTGTDTTFNTTCKSVGSCSSLLLNGDITGGGGLIKEGKGSLILAGENTYTGDTVVNDGILVVTGSSTSSTTVSSDGLLKGNGEIGNIEVYGGISGGASIGVLTVNGDLTYEAGSTFYVEVSPTATSFIDVSGAVTVGEGTTVLTVPFPGEYDGPVSYVVLGASSVTGIFSSVTAPPAFYMLAEASYTGTEVILTVTPETIAPLNAGANVDAVVVSLNDVIDWNRENVELEIPNINVGSTIKLPALLASMLPINDDSSEIASALDQMHPALFKNVVVAQENATVQVQESLSIRLNEEMETLDCARTRQAYTFWINGMGAATNQDNNTYKGSPQVGYNNTMAGFTTGVDYRFKDLLYVGALGGYTSSYLSFEKNRGSGNVHTGYFGLYASAIGEGYFANASVTGGWNGYSANRHIEYTGVDVTAKNSHGGRQLMSHIEGGLNLPLGRFNIRPFDRFDYLTQKEYGYKEKDAGDWNLSVNKNTSILLRNELGLQFASCFQVKTGKLTVSPKVSWVREVRTRGSTYTAAFTDAEDFSFTVKGYFPNRSLLSTGGVLTGSLLDDTLSLSAYYDGEFTSGYSAHRYGGEVRYSF